MRIRLAQPADAPGIQAIYAPVVVETAVSFETEPPTVAEMSARVAETLPDHPWLVLEDEGSILGYSYGHGFGARAAYRWSVETSIYIHADARGRGAGLALYTALLAVLRPQGYRQAIGGIALPNPASVALPQSLGFTAVGVYRRNYIDRDRTALTERNAEAAAQNSDFDSITEVFFEDWEAFEAFRDASADPAIRAQIVADEVKFLDPSAIRRYIVTPDGDSAWL